MTYRCRSCGGEQLTTFLQLGKTPLANSLLRPEDIGRAEPVFPLDVAFCRDCTLVQLLETVPPERMFSEYLYFSSTSSTMVAHAGALVDRLVTERRLDGDSLVVEIASNDGYLLQWYAKRSIAVLGIEPARNIAKVAVERGVPTECVFFGSDEAARLSKRRQADVIHANNVLAHVPDLNGFVRGIAMLLEPDGIAVIEVPYVRDLVDHLEFDTIYHEHLCYFSATALDALFRRHGLVVEHIERLPIHGGSLRLFVAHGPEGSSSSIVVRQLLDEEARNGLCSEAYYASFSQRVQSLGDDLTRLLRTLRASGSRIAAYGASAKGSTLLNTFGIGRDLLDFVVDRSPHKQGRLMPGVHLPILAPDALLERRPDHVLLLTWNFAAEILEQQDLFRRGGGRFVVPIPKPEVI
jgi:SAM-dependent methyltransferase